MTLIWRYMSLAEFLSLLEFRKLVFTRADKFQDVFEGKLPETFFLGWTKEKRDLYQKIYTAHKQSKMKTYINCWSNIEKESYAMWQIYAKDYGIALQTTVNKLQEAIGNQKIEIRKVQYVDYRKDLHEDLPLYWDENEGILKKNFFIYKSKAYEFENELRLLTMDEGEKPYIEVSVDINKLLSRVYVSPFAEIWFAKLIEKLICDRFNLTNIKIIMSDIEINQ